MTQTFSIMDFSKGVSDYIFRVNPSFAEKMVNFQVQPDQSIIVRNGSDLFDQTKPRWIDGRISKMKKIGNEFLCLGGQNTFIKNKELLGPTDNKLFFSGSNDTRFSIEKLGNNFFISNTERDLPLKLYIDQNSILRAVTAGLPLIPFAGQSAPQVTGSGSTVYTYAVTLSREYESNGRTYKDVSSPYIFNGTNLTDLDAGGSNQVVNLPVITNTAPLNYDTANIKIEIFRSTKSSGSVLYKVGEVSNGTASFQDSTTDTDAINNLVLYTSRGIKPNGTPPKAKYLVESNSCVFYLNTADNPQRGYQSIQHDGDSVPSDYFFNIDSDITGGGSVNDKLVVMSKTKTFRIDGLLDEFNNGSLIPENISEEVGCIANDSVVQTQEGIYYFSLDGVYFTDAYRTTKISDQLDKTYRKIIERPEAIQGAYDRYNKRVYWTYADTEDDADSILIFNERSKAFYHLNGGQSFAPSSILFDDDLVRADKRGYIFKHNRDLYTDLEVNLNAPVSEWRRIAIEYLYKTVAWDLGRADSFKWITQLGISGQPDTNVDMQINSSNEGRQEYLELTPTDFRPEFVWGDETFEWGDEEFTWDSVEFFNYNLKFPASGLRAKHRQLELKNAIVEIKKSTENTDSYLAINATTKTATTQTAQYLFGAENSYDGYILEINDQEYLIKHSTETTLLLDDENNSLQTGTYPYIIKGFIKGQRPHIHEMKIYYNNLDADGGFSV